MFSDHQTTTTYSSYSGRLTPVSGRSAPVSGSTTPISGRSSPASLLNNSDGSFEISSVDINYLPNLTRSASDPSTDHAVFLVNRSTSSSDLYNFPHSQSIESPPPSPDRDFAHNIAKKLNLKRVRSLFKINSTLDIAKCRKADTDWKTNKHRNKAMIWWSNLKCLLFYYTPGGHHSGNLVIAHIWYKDQNQLILSPAIRWNPERYFMFAYLNALMNRTKSSQS